MEELEVEKNEPAILCPSAVAAQIVEEAKAKAKAAFDEFEPVCVGQHKYLLKPLQMLSGMLTNPQTLGLGQGFMVDKALKAQQDAFDKLLEQTAQDAEALAKSAEESEPQFEAYLQNKEFAGRIKETLQIPKEGEAKRGIISDIASLVSAYRSSVDAHDPKAFIAKARELFPIIDRVLKSKFLSKLLGLSEKLAKWIDLYKTYLDAAQELKGFNVAVAPGANNNVEKAIVLLQNNLFADHSETKRVVDEYKALENAKAAQQAAMIAKEEPKQEAAPAAEEIVQPVADLEAPKQEQPKQEEPKQEAEDKPETATEEAQASKAKKTPKK